MWCFAILSISIYALGYDWWWDMPRNLKAYKKKSKPLKAAKFSKVKRDALIKKMREVAKQTLNRNLETKQVVNTQTDGQEIFHNNFIYLSHAPFATQQGTADGDALGVTGVRIGDEVLAKGYKMKFMVELNERYSDVTFRLLMIKSAKGDVPTRTTLFHGQSGNKMLDSINTERYTIVHQKWFKIKAPNLSIAGEYGQAGEHTTTVPPGGTTGIYFPIGDPSYNTLSRATKIVKFWVPASKFTKNGILRYQNQSAQCKFFDYTVLLYAYSNYSTLQDVFYVARLNDVIEQFYFKDA